MATKKTTGGAKAPKEVEKKSPEQVIAEKATERQYKVPFISARIDRMSTDPNSRHKANASIVIGNHFAVPGFRIYDGGAEKGLRVLNPATKGTDGKYYENFHAITKEGHEALNKYIIEAYEQKLDQTQGEDQAAGEDEEPAFEQTM